MAPCIADLIRATLPRPEGQAQGPARPGFHDPSSPDAWRLLARKLMEPFRPRCKQFPAGWRVERQAEWPRARPSGRLG